MAGYVKQRFTYPQIWLIQRNAACRIFSLLIRIWARKRRWKNFLQSFMSVPFADVSANCLFAREFAMVDDIEYAQGMNTGKCWHWFVVADWAFWSIQPFLGHPWMIIPNYSLPWQSPAIKLPENLTASMVPMAPPVIGSLLPTRYLPHESCFILTTDGQPSITLFCASLEVIPGVFFGFQCCSFSVRVTLPE